MTVNVCGTLSLSVNVTVIDVLVGRFPMPLGVNAYPGSAVTANEDEPVSSIADAARAGALATRNRAPLPTRRTTTTNATTALRTLVRLTLATSALKRTRDGACDSNPLRTNFSNSANGGASTVARCGSYAGHM